MSREIRWVRKPEEKAKAHRCPCCGYKTLRGRGQDEICEVCFWQDDGQDQADADIVLGGPNGSLSLSDAQANFRRFSAVQQRFKSKVRAPEPDEI